MRTPDGEVSCQGWVFGWDPTRVAPIFVREFAILHGCLLALQTLQRYQAEGLPSPGTVCVRAGDHATCDRLQDWFSDGAYHFSSAAGSGVVALLYQLAEILPCPLIIQSTDADQYTGGQEWDEAGVPSSFVLRTQVRLLNGFLRTALPQTLSRVPRIPLTKSEVKERLRHRFETDERRCLLLLAKNDSISSTLFIEWGLTRAVIKSALQDLSYNRRMQVTLASVLTGTRFKFFDTMLGGGSARLPTVCKLCGERDSPAHILSHAKIDGPPIIPEEKVQFLVTIAQVAEVINPHLSTPWYQEHSKEIELELDPDSGDSDEEELNSLSFEGDLSEIDK